jgi:hypothetical protein
MAAMSLNARTRKHKIVRRGGREFILDNGRECEVIVKRGDMPETDLLNFPAVALECGLSVPTVASRQNKRRPAGWPTYDRKPLPEENYPIKHPLGFYRDQRFIRRKYVDLVKGKEDKSNGRYFRDGAWRLTETRAAGILGWKKAGGDFEVSLRKVLGVPSSKKIASKRVRSDSGQLVTEYLEDDVLRAKDKRDAAPPRKKKTRIVERLSDRPDGWMTWRELAETVSTQESNTILKDLLKHPRWTGRAEKAERLAKRLAHVQRFAIAERVRKALQAERAHAREGDDYIRSSRKGRAIYHEPTWAQRIVDKVAGGDANGTLPIGPNYSVRARNEFWLSLYDKRGPFYRNAPAIRDYWNRVAPKEQRISAARNGSQMVLVGIGRARKNRKTRKVSVSTFLA